MNVNKFKKGGVGLVIITLLLSCNNFNNQKEVNNKNKYQVLSYILKKYTENNYPPVAFPPSPKGNPHTFTTKDSLRVYKNFYDALAKENTFTIDTTMYVPTTNYDDLLIKCNNETVAVKVLLKKLNSLKKNKSIVVDNIFVEDKTTIIPYDKAYKKLDLEGFGVKYDALFSFSRITFNKEYTKAIVIVNFKQERLNSQTSLLYLEKKNYHWQLVCETGLSIS